MNKPVRGVFLLAPIMGGWNMLRARTVAFWHWSATWKWLELLVIGLYAGAVAVDEYIAAMVFAFLAAIGAFSRLHHAKHRPLLKFAGSVGVLLVWLYLTAISAAKLGEKPASNLVILWNRYGDVKPLPKYRWFPSYPPDFTKFSPTNIPIPQKVATVKLEVYISEVFRFKARALNFKNLDDLRQAIGATINGERPERYLIPLNHNVTDLNVIVRNVGTNPIKNARVTIMSNIPIEGKTEGAHVFAPDQINYEDPLIEPYEPLGSEKFFSIRLATSNDVTMFVPLVEITSSNMKPYAALRAIKIEKSAKVH